MYRVEAGPVSNSTRPASHDTFRFDIQAFRGIAVLAVFIFHLWPGAIPSGFLGVDIFFVISGFLLALLYDIKTLQQTWDFFIKRARRILPAYFVVLVATLLAASVLVLPHELQTLAGDAAASLAFAPNIGFWADNSYFDKATFKPLLHFWSLGVELQFYLLFPLIELCARKYPRFTASIGIASFAACLIAAGISPKTAFFLLPFRLWEFLAGFYAARYAARLFANGPGDWSPRIGKWIGPGLLIGLIVLLMIPISEAEHPKWSALGVTILCAALLATRATETAFATLPARPLIVVGKYSYSIYLVHFPVIVLWFHQPFAGNTMPAASAKDILAVTALTALFSVLLFHAVERPARRLKTFPFLKLQAGLMAAGLLAIAILPQLARRNFTHADLQISDAWLDRSFYRCGKLARLVEPFAASCALTSVRDGAPAFLLVGDSHADAIKPAMISAAAEAGIQLRLMKDNYALGAGSVSVAAVVAEVAAQGVSTVILHSSNNAQKAEDVAELVRAAETKGFHVVLIEPVPSWPVHVPLAMYRARHGGPPLSPPTLSDYQARNGEFLRAIGEIKSDNFTRYSPVGYFCSSVCKTTNQAGDLLYFDNGHLTKTGAHLLDPLFHKLLVENKRR